MIYLVSYPHSGNTWMRYCVEFVSQQPTHGHQAFSISERNNNFLNVDLTKPAILLKRHELKENEITLSDKFVLLVRGPHHCIKVDSEDEYRKYYSLLEHFDSFKGSKICLYFNDLFDCPDVLKLFMPVNLDKFNELKSNLKFHQEQCLSIYQNRTKQEGVGLKSIPYHIWMHPLVKKTW